MDWIQVPVVANMMNKGKKKGGGCEKQNLSAILLVSALILDGAADDPTEMYGKRYAEETYPIAGCWGSRRHGRGAFLAGTDAHFAILV